MRKLYFHNDKSKEIIINKLWFIFIEINSVWNDHLPDHLKKGQIKMEN